jgi:hypothetical protein
MDIHSRIIGMFEYEENRLRVMRGVRSRIMQEDGLLDRPADVTEDKMDTGDINANTGSHPDSY